MRFIAFFLLLSIAACSPQKRLERLIDRHPELFVSDTTLFTTTIVKTDTIYIPSDTSIFTITKTDTVYEDSVVFVYITKDKLKIITKPKNIYHTDTVQTIKYIVKNNVAKETNKYEQFYKFMLFGFVIILITGIIRKIFKK